jgi:ubiquinone/menaquinone biosynthesis methyltransferase
VTIPSRPALRAALATPESKRQYVRRLFSTIADRYDLITVVLSFGQDRKWKRRLVSLAGSVERRVVLDLACGTGDITFELAAAGATPIGLDMTPRMLELARAKAVRPVRPHFLAGDMMALPFGDAQFDVITTGYGIRNVPVLQTAIAEIARVLKPGGVFLSLDFNRPVSRLVRAVYLAYLTLVGSALGLLLHRDPNTYRYIPESIRRYPGADAVCGMVREHGFATCDYVPILGGLLAIHVGVRSRISNCV